MSNLFPITGFSLTVVSDTYWETAGVCAPNGGFPLRTIRAGYWDGLLVLNERRGAIRLGGLRGVIAGSVTLDGAPVARTVRIHHRASGIPCATLVSGGDGGYQAEGFSGEDEYYVVALPSPADGANAVIADRVRGA